MINEEEFIQKKCNNLQRFGYCLHYFLSRNLIIEAYTGLPFVGLIINRFFYLIMFNLSLCNSSFNNAEEIH